MVTCQLDRYFVVTHHPPPMGAGRRLEFMFVPEGVPDAIEAASQAAGDRYVTIGGGADIARQFLSGGLVDEVQMHVVPVLLGKGTALFSRSDTRW